MRSLRFFLLLLSALAASGSNGPALGADLRGAGLADGEADVGGAGLLEHYLPPPEPVRLPALIPPEELRAVAAAAAYGPYADVFQILKDENTCSRFFGGPGRALEVLNAMARRLSERSVGGRSVGIRMSGEYTSYRNARTGLNYRLFEAAAVNTNGPFNTRLPSQAFNGLRVGSFEAGTRAGRALIILHELGHLIEGPGGDWLLPNDGYDQARSHENTRAVEKPCFGQLRRLR